MTANGKLISRLESLLDASRVVSDPAVRAEYAVDEILPAVVAQPALAEEAAEIVRFAALEKLAIIPCGNRTKLCIGMPPARYDIALDMTGINQIAHYNPDEFTLSVDAGTNFNEFAVPLYNQKQFLPLSVPFYFESTIGGIIASGVDCGLRHSYGTAEEFLTGAEFIDGTGKLRKSVGLAVKNAAGDDFHRHLIGSLGALGVITRLDFRTFAAAPASRGFVASFRTADDALVFQQLIVGSPISAASIELLSPELMQQILDAEKNSSEPLAAPLEGKFPADAWHLCISVEGTPEACERFSRDLQRMAGQPAAKSLLFTEFSENEAADLWHYIGQAAPLLLEAFPGAAIFKIEQPTSRLGPLFAQIGAIAERAGLPHSLLARACGVVYFALLPIMEEANSVRRLAEAASVIFELCAKENAAVTLPWCPTALKRTVNICGPPQPELDLMRSLKTARDPQNIFAPGRF
jgi:FAD/FMN-containing dehydrogenase